MDPLGYEIMEGVRRSVACLSCGRVDIAAEIITLGQPSLFSRIPLTMLYSRKPVIPRDLRYIRDTEYPTVVLGNDPPYIHVVPRYNSTRLKYLTPVANVKLV